jgi:phosphate transport system permease protein
MAEQTTLPVTANSPLDWAARCAAATVAAVFLWIFLDIMIRGVSGLQPGFLFGDVADAGRAGGILPIIVSTLAILVVCLLCAVPLALATAVWLSEYCGNGGRLASLVRGSLDVLAGVPSIVFGLFGNAVFCIWMGFGFSILSGGLTLACMALPLIIRTTEISLRSVPDDYRRAGAALGISRSTLLRHVLLPAALPGLLAGLVLGIGRALAETAALIFTSGYVTRMPGSVTDSGRTLSVHIYDLAMNVSGGDANACRAAFVLLLLLIGVNLTAAALTRKVVG